MEKYVNCLDLYEVYEEANKMLFSALAKIEPSTEYRPFIEQNKRLVLPLTCQALKSNCLNVSSVCITTYQNYNLFSCSKEGPSLVSYDFDASLLKLPTVQVAPAGHIAINNLTATPLREK